MMVPGVTVVTAWPGSCPECLEDGAIFMVHSDESVSVRCLTTSGCYKPRQVLLGDGNYWVWVETDVYGNFYDE